MNILVLCDNQMVLARAKPILEKRKVARWTFTTSDDINPKLDYEHIIKTYDLVFSIHCRKIFPKKLLDGVRCVNVHPGMNPFNRGACPNAWSIINGYPAGVTIHEMAVEIDLGVTLESIEVEVLESDNSESLYNKLIDAEMFLLDEKLDDVIENKSERRIETNKGNYNSVADFKNLCEIDLDKTGTFREFYNLLRALSHGDYWNAHIKDTNLYLKLMIHEKD